MEKKGAPFSLIGILTNKVWKNPLRELGVKVYQIL